MSSVSRFARRALAYPAVRRCDQVDNYHGVTVADPYRWLEDPGSEETKAFVGDQVSLAQTVFGEFSEERGKISATLRASYNYPKYSVPARRGSLYCYYHNTGLQNQSVLFVQETLESPARVLLDPNTMSSDGTASVSTAAFSKSGSHLAYGISQSGSDWSTIHVRDVATAQDLEDRLEWIKFSSIAWTHDGAGFYYCRYPEEAEIKDKGAETKKNEHHKVYYHRLGQRQAQDALVYEEPEHPAYMFGVEVTDCGRYLVLTVSESTDPVNKFYLVDLTVPEGARAVRKVVDTFDAEYAYITNDGDDFYLRTNLKAPNYKLVRMSLADPRPEAWTVIVDEHPRDVLETVAPVDGDKLFVVVTRDACNALSLHNLATGAKIKDVELPSLGSVSLSCKREDREMFFKFDGFLYPGTIFRYGMAEGAARVFREIDVPGFDRSEFVSERVFYESKDGTRVPLFVTHRRGLARDGENPTLLYGYGGFSISMTPYFSTFRVAMMRCYGAVVAVACLRGGGEYGETWHKAGCLGSKQNVFDDFFAAAEYLHRERYTSPKRTAIQGGSNGGLLVAACANQRPELFAAGIASCGVLDMLRFHRFTIGYAWKSDYGCADDDLASFNWLRAYSPVHTVSRAKAPFPAMLLTTADHDDRVVPLHTYKYLAELQHTLGALPEQQGRPLIARIDVKAGHGAGKPTEKVIDEVADIYGFFGHAVGATWTEKK